MQVTIKDSLIKSILADYVENQLDRRSASLVKELMEDARVQASIAKELSRYFNEEADVIMDVLGDVKMPALDRAIKEQDARG